MIAKLAIIQGSTCLAISETGSLRNLSPRARRLISKTVPPSMPKASRWKISTKGKSHFELRMALPKNDWSHHSQNPFRNTVKNIRARASSGRRNSVGDSASCSDNGGPQDQRYDGGQFGHRWRRRIPVPLCDAAAQRRIEDQNVDYCQYQHDHFRSKENRAVEGYWIATEEKSSAEKHDPESADDRRVELIEDVGNRLAAHRHAQTVKPRRTVRVRTWIVSTMGSAHVEPRSVPLKLVSWSHSRKLTIDILRYPSRPHFASHFVGCQPDESGIRLKCVLVTNGWARY